MERKEKEKNAFTLCRENVMDYVPNTEEEFFSSKLDIHLVIYKKLLNI